MRTRAAYAAMVEAALPALLSGSGERAPSPLIDAMGYSLMAGGKRLRPSMLLAAVELLGGDAETALAQACAVEMIHTYSLIHDDLPGMDDDTLRRGRPTNHVVYGVGQAILAGDGLLSRAFELLLEDAASDPISCARKTAAALEIARGAGACGMVAGQCVDLRCERDRAGTMEDLLYIHEKKTACMFIYPLRAAARIAGADDRALLALTAYGRAFGLMFQAADDLLDVEGDAKALGKSVGKDAAEGKLTAVAMLGIDGARARVDALMDEGLGALCAFDDRADFFRELIRAMQGRAS